MSRSISKMAVVLVTVLCIIMASTFSASSSTTGNHDVLLENGSVQLGGENRSTGSTATQTVSSGQYFIKNKSSGKYLTYSGVNVAQYSRSNATTMQQQRWNVVYTGNGYYYLEPMNNVGYRLDINNAADYNGTNVGIHPKNGNAAQKYQILSCGNGSYRLVPACSTTRVVEVSGASTDEGANVQIWEYVGQSQQQWIFESASSEPYHAYEWSWVFEDGNNTYISNGYRTKYDDHYGIDLIRHPSDNTKTIYGNNILSPTSGQVMEIIDNHYSGGHMVIIQTDNYTTDGKPIRVAFLHMILDSCPLRDEEFITAGTVVGQVGSTGESTGPHLHLSTFNSDTPTWPSAQTAINPQRFFKYISFANDVSIALSYPVEEELQ